MKNNRQTKEITSEDFDSLNMLESILENNQARTPIYFLAESPFSRRGICHFDSFHCFARNFFRKLKKKQAVSKSRAERLKKNSKINGEIKNYVSFSINFR